MSSEAEMRKVLLHAADKLEKVKDAKIKTGYQEYSMMPGDVLLAMAYAEGVLRLLATYLKIDEAPARNGHQPDGETSRDAKILAAAQAGEKLTEIAHRFGISESRVRQIRDTAQQQAAG